MALLNLDAIQFYQPSTQLKGRRKEVFNKPTTQKPTAYLSHFQTAPSVDMGPCYHATKNRTNIELASPIPLSKTLNVHRVLESNTYRGEKDVNGPEEDLFPTINAS